MDSKLENPNRELKAKIVAKDFSLTATIQN